MRYIEIIQENTEPDDELFGTPTVPFDDVFNEYDEDQLMAQGFQYGDHPDSDIDILNDYLENWGKDFRVVGISGGEHDLVLHIDKTGRLHENDDDELFGARGYNFAGASAEEIKEKFNDLWEELYGYESYYDDEDDPDFQDKKQELDALLGYVRIRWGEGFYNHLKDWGDTEKRQQSLDRYYARQSNDPLVRRGRDDPRITKAGKINRQDQQALARDIGKRIGKHPAPPLPESESDDDLFGPSASGAKNIVYRTGKQILARLEQSWMDPAVQKEYKEYLEAGDDDAMFDQVVRLTRVKFKHAFVVDTILREFTSMEGLNDFGRMLMSGEFHDLVDAWERFREDPDIEQEPWFQREVQDFKGER